MKRKEALRLLAQLMMQDGESEILIHPRFLKEMKELVENASGSEKEILNLLVRQLGYVRDFSTRVDEVDGNEKLKSTDRDYYSLHLKGKGFNIRLLMAFLSDGRPVLLVAFFERAGKSISDYSKYMDVLGQRYDEMESEENNE